MLYALQCKAHDQAGGYQPPVFFGRKLLELEAVGEGLRGLSGFLFWIYANRSRLLRFSGPGKRGLSGGVNPVGYFGNELNKWHCSKSLNK